MKTEELLDACAVTERRVVVIDKISLEDGLGLLSSGRRDEKHYQRVRIFNIFDMLTLI